MNPLYSEFKRKFSVSMFKNMGISLGEMSFFKDFVNDLRGDPYPLMEKGEGCEYRIYSKDGMREAQFRFPDGGFRGWGCIIPVSLGSKKRYFWLTFDRHNGSDYNWSYGNMYCFEA